MRATTVVLTLAGGLGLLSACTREPPAETAPPVAETREQSGTGAPADVSPVSAETWLDGFAIGREVRPDGTIAAEASEFMPGQPVHVSMEVSDAPAQSAVKVVWYAPDQTRIGEETKPVAADQRFLNFTATDTASWAAGRYRAEIWVGDEKVRELLFQITERSGDRLNRLKGTAPAAVRVVSSFTRAG